VKPAIKVDDILEYLQSKLSFAIRDCQPAAEGADHIVLLLRLQDSREVVVKVGSEASVDAFVLKQLVPLGCKVPLLLWTGILSLKNNVAYPLLVMTKCKGSLISTLAKEARYFYVPAILQEMQNVYEVPYAGNAGLVSQISSEKKTSWQEYLMRVLRGNTADFDWKSISTRPGVCKSLLFQGLQKAQQGIQQLPNNRTITLLHGDLNSSNIFVLNNSLESIIDWSDALYGDFLFDLARFRMSIERQMCPRGLSTYFDFLKLSSLEKQLEELYFLIHVLMYVNWYSLCGDIPLVEYQMNLLERIIYY